MYAELNRDLWYILVAKTPGEAYTKVNGSNTRKGNGLDGFTEMTRFYTKVTHTPVQELRKKCMSPDKANKEEDIWNKTDKWRENVAHLQQIDPALEQIRGTSF